MKIKEAIILAGGEGTRLQGVLPGIPKCLAPVHGKPFLFYLLHHLQQQGITSIYFALGKQATEIKHYLETNHPDLRKFYSEETSPLGTGGAIRKALELVSCSHLLIANGDSIFKASLENAAIFHERQNSSCTVLLRPMQDTSRYGSVELDKTGRILSFKEKQSGKAGLINAGSYLLNRQQFLEKPWPQEFSFEKDYLERFLVTDTISGYDEGAYFIDIGIPADYEKAQSDWIHF